MMHPVAQDPDALLNRAKELDNSAVGALFSSQQDTVTRLVAARYDRRLAARVDVEDIVQDVWAEAMCRFPAYINDLAVSFPDWLHGVALDCLAHCHRAHILTKKRSICAEVQFHDRDSRRARDL